MFELIRHTITPPSVMCMVFVYTHGRKKEREEGSIVAPPNTVVHPLAMMITIVHAIIALQTESKQLGPHQHTRRNFFDNHWFQ